MHPDDHARLAERVARLAERVAGRADDDSHPILLRLLRRDGGWTWVETTARSLTAPDGSRRLLATSRDVSARREAEQALAEASQRLQTLVDNVPVAILEAELDGTVTLWNPEAERLFGWQAQEVLGRRTPLLPPEELSAAVAAVAAGTPIRHEASRRRKDGTSVEVIVSAVPRRSETGEVVGILATMLDVSERKALEERLQQAQRLEAIGQLAGGVAHDFNNLLTAIGGYQELALQRAGDDEELRRQLGAIGQASSRAAGLTGQLLAFGRRQLLQPHVFDLNDAVAQTESLLARVLGGEVEVVTVLDRGGCPVRADQTQVEQVLINLAANARDAMPAGGTITIETAGVALSQGDAAVFGGAEGDYVRLRVSDTGHGMDEHTRTHAFEPFFTTKEQGKGTGLGLATVYGIVSQSGGGVAVRSRPGEGACFELLLPRSGAAPEPQHGPRPSAASGRARVLLVEDEQIVRELTHEMLEGHGYEVVAAANAEEALVLARDAGLDALVTDVVMPGMNGRALAAALRATMPDLHVLYVSGFSDDAALQDGALEPLATFLQKPYSAAELGEALQRTLDAVA